MFRSLNSHFGLVCLVFFCLTFFQSTTTSQTLGPQLNVNNITVGVSPKGQLFRLGSESPDADFGQFTIKENGKDVSTIFAGGLWMGGVDQDGNLYVAAELYTENRDYQMGPIGSDPKFFERIWSLTHEEISAFRKDIADGIQDEDWSSDLSDWPALGNTLVAENGSTFEITEELAPFVDVNDDQIYNPLDGDYPKIKGQKTLFWIFNDDKTHHETYSDPLKVEVVASLYANKCEEINPINRSIFLDYKITNKSSKDYQEFSFGFWSEPQLGCHGDEYVGSIPDHNAYYAYNEGQFDFGYTYSSCTTNSFQSIPSQSIVLLNHQLTGFLPVSLSGNINPNIPSQYYNVLLGMWPDATHLTYGGSGYNPFSSDYTQFAFPGNPSIPNEWSMCSKGIGFVDQRVFMSTKAITLKQNESVDFHIGFVTTNNVALPCPSPEPITNDIRYIQRIYELGASSYDLDLGPDLTIAPGQTIRLDAGFGAHSYRWSTNETTPAVEINAPGIYSISITDYFGCVHFDEVNVISNIPPFPTEFSIYPNPSNGGFTIQKPSTMVIENISLFNLLGQKMINDFNSNFDPTSNEILIKNLQPGTYILNIETSEKQISEVIIVFE